MAKSGNPNWKTGESGNPEGRKPLPPEKRVELYKLGLEAFEVIAQIMRSAEDETVRLNAAVKLVEKSYGWRPLFDEAIPKDVDGKIDLATEVLLRIGLGGDVPALKTFLAAYDKEHFGPPKEETATKDSSQISVVFTPAVTTSAG